jgi:hypothetical protein
MDDLVRLYHCTNDEHREGIERIGFTSSWSNDRAGTVSFCETWEAVANWTHRGPWIVILTGPRSLAEATRVFLHPDDPEPYECAVPVEKVNAFQPFTYRLHAHGPPTD